MATRGPKLVILILCGLFGLFQVLSSEASVAQGAKPGLRAQRPRTPNPNAPKQSPAAPKYSRFTHHVSQHQQACDACHKFPSANWKEVRKGSDAFPDVTDYPEHASCLGCHRQQFFKGAVPTICSVCHVRPSPSNGVRHPFANPREIFDSSEKGQNRLSEFSVYFPHDKHEALFGKNGPGAESGAVGRFVRTSFSMGKPARNRAAPQSTGCATCHQTFQPQGDSDEEYVTKPPASLSDDAFWLKKGTFKGGLQSHAKCFECHSPEGGLEPAGTNCVACHKLIPRDQIPVLNQSVRDFDPQMASAMGIKDKRTLLFWRRREAVKYRHEWVAHVDINCTDCHTVAQINTLSDKGPQINVMSCGGTGGCHITATAEEGGALNVELDQKKKNAGFQCIKCHALGGKKPAPESHLKAVAKFAGKQ